MGWPCSFCPAIPGSAASARRRWLRRFEKQELAVLGWRDVPADNRCLGDLARAAEPVVRQLFIGGNGLEDEELERRLYLARKRAERLRGRTAGPEAEWFYVPSMSCRTICYKGMFLAPQLFAYYPDLADPRMKTALAVVHQRYSTNTFPSWRLAQPFRMIAHNGEINTLRGNAGRLQAREKTMVCPALGKDLSELYPNSPAGRQRLGLFRQLHGAVGPGRPLAAARPDDDDSRGLRAAVTIFPPTSGRFTNIMRRSWSPGTARRPWSSPTAGWSAARWTATACVPAATWSPPTAWSCSPARRA